MINRSTLTPGLSIPRGIDSNSIGQSAIDGEASTMQVKYDFTIVDLADLSHQFGKRHPLFYTWRTFRSAIVAFLLTLAFYALTSGPQIERLVGSLAFVVSIFLLLSQVWLIPNRRQYEAYLRARLGSQGPFSFEVEITEAFLRTNQLGENTYRDWRGITGVRETKSGIWFDLRLGSFIFVRHSGFQSSSDRNEFLRLAKQYIHASGSDNR